MSSQAFSAVKIPVIMLDRRAFDAVPDDDGKYRVALKLDGSLFEGPHGVNFIIPCETELEEMSLPIEAASGTIQTHLIALLRPLLNLNEEDSGRGIFIATAGSGSAEAPGCVFCVYCARTHVPVLCAVRIIVCPLWSHSQTSWSPLWCTNLMARRWRAEYIQSGLVKTRN